MPRNTTRSRESRSTFVLLLLLAAISSPLGAIETSIEGDLLTIRGFDGEDIVVEASPTGEVLVNGLEPDVGPVLAGAIGRIDIFGDDGDNVIDLSGLDPSRFTGLAFLGSIPPVIVHAGGGDDVVIGSIFLEEVFGEEGNDRVVWSAGGRGDRVDGGDGEDTIEVRGGDDAELFLVDSTSGGSLRIRQLWPRTEDVLADGVEHLELDGGAENDEIDLRSVAGADLVTAAVFGGEGDDTFTVGRGAGMGIDLTVDGGPGRDTVNYANYGFHSIFVNLPEGRSTELQELVDVEDAIGGSGDDVLAGNDDANLLRGGEGDDALFGGGGDDVLDGGTGANFIDGGPGSDRVDFSGSPVGVKVSLDNKGGGKAKSDSKDELLGIEGVIGSEFDDVIKSKLPSVTIIGGGGDDKIKATSGFNSIDGGSGNDKISTGRGNDTVDGGDGDDRIVDKGGDNLLQGGDGNDRIIAKRGSGNLLGGPGDDFIKGPSDNAELRGGDGDDRIKGGKGNDLVYGEAGNDNLRGGSGDDLVYGGDGDDTIRGDKGRDGLFGGPGIDAIRDDRDDAEVDPGPEP